MSSSIPSWQILTAHVQPFRGARDLAFCLKVPLDSLLVWASSGGSGETARIRRLAWTFAAHIGDKYQIRLTRPKLKLVFILLSSPSVIFQLHFCFVNYLLEINYIDSLWNSLSSNYHCHKIIDLIIANLLQLINCCAPQMALSWLLNQSHQHMLLLAYLFSGWYVIAL